MELPAQMQQQPGASGPYHPDASSPQHPMHPYGSSEPGFVGASNRDEPVGDVKNPLHPAYRFR
jgi:hypothetical protein